MKDRGNKDSETVKEYGGTLIPKRNMMEIGRTQYHMEKENTPFQTVTITRAPGMRDNKTEMELPVTPMVPS